MRRRGGGNIVIVTSEWGVTGWPRATAYASSKAGLIALTKSLGRELAHENITVNAVAPGVIDTPQLEVDAADAGVSLAEMHRPIRTRHPRRADRAARRDRRRRRVAGPKRLGRVYRSNNSDQRRIHPMPGMTHDSADSPVVGQVDGLVVPRFAGHSTFARLPRIEDVPRYDVAIAGVPFDTGVTYRPGARFGPAHIRQSSRLLRPYNPALDISPFADSQVVDAGDVVFNPFDITTAVRQIEQQAPRADPRRRRARARSAVTTPSPIPY